METKVYKDRRTFYYYLLAKEISHFGSMIQNGVECTMGIFVQNDIFWTPITSHQEVCAWQINFSHEITKHSPYGRDAA